MGKCWADVRGWDGLSGIRFLGRCDCGVGPAVGRVIVEAAIEFCHLRIPFLLPDSDGFLCVRQLTLDHLHALQHHSSRSASKDVVNALPTSAAAL